MDDGDGHQSHQRLPVLPRGLPAPEGRGRRQDHQHRLDDVDLRRALCAGLRREQGRHRAADQGDGRQLGPGRHPGQRGVAGMDPDRTHRWCAGAGRGLERTRGGPHRRRTLGPAERPGRHRGVPGQRRIGLRHRHGDSGGWRLLDRGLAARSIAARLLGRSPTGHSVAPSGRSA
ncbi:hypothetical protein VARIO8X_120095 [Burkholderiales bacterium 8X]|nr:hypothetical protein VARIO8X_120095 [Burkholderiales bacterium 8X]